MKSAIYLHANARDYLFQPMVWRRLWIVTGGQSGVDRAAADLALELRLPLRGWCPKNRQAEDGRIPEHYPMQETDSEDPALRTELNAFDSDGTLVLSQGVPKDGTPLTEEVARLHSKPYFFVSLEEELSEEVVLEFRTWVEQNQIRILNIGGPRESYAPGEIYARARERLRELLAL